MERIKTRKQAAEEIMVLYNSLEPRPVSFNTIYNRVFKSGNVWRLIGYQHDYTA